MDPIVRPAEASDLGAIADAMYQEPLPDFVGLVGNPERARAIGVELLKLEGVTDPMRPWVVAEYRRRFVGALQWTNSSIKAPVTMRMKWTVVRIAGVPRIPSMLPRERARVRVHVKPPPNSFHIRELHVPARLQGHGIGTLLLEWAEREARRREFLCMSLITHTSNPARRLYERMGFRVTETRTDPKFERYTGVAGRVLVEKEFEPFSPMGSG